MEALKVITRTSLSQPEKDTLFRWGEDLWDNDRYGLTWRGTDVHFVGYEDNEPVAHAGACLHTMRVNGDKMRLGGLNSVITIPKARSKGYGGLVVEAAEIHMRNAMGVDFGMLFCHPELEAFYSRRGWQTIQGPVVIDQPDGPRDSPHTVMVLPCKDQEWTNRPITLGSMPW